MKEEGRMFEKHTAHIDWCEPKYAVTFLIAEFGNTVSNILFLIIPPLLIYLSRFYSRHISSHINLVWIMLILVGLTSMYFHTTLSLLGQLLDEISIIWVLALSMSFWFPKRYLPGIFRDKREYWHYAMMTLAGLGTFMSFWKPSVNAVVLMMFGLVAAPLAFIELYRSYRAEDWACFNLLCRVICTYGIACFLWWSDRVYCDAWLHINFPYGHSLWHVFIFIASYSYCVAMAYCWARTESPELLPALSYWPTDSWNFFGVPYISLRCLSPMPTKYL